MQELPFNIQKIAKLSMLTLTEQEEKKYEALLREALESIETLPQAGDFEVKPQVVTMKLREDKVCPSTKRDDLLASAPQVEAGCFVVPKIVE